MRTLELCQHVLMYICACTVCGGIHKCTVRICIHYNINGIHSRVQTKSTMKVHIVFMYMYVYATVSKIIIHLCFAGGTLYCPFV